MVGTVDCCDLSSAGARQSSSQASLRDYREGDETFVNIVHNSDDDIEAVTDERDRRLAPPTGLFDDWLEKRDELRANPDNSGRLPHNEAYDLVRYRKRFREDLGDRVIEEYADRVRDGEDIVFVCYCDNGRYCHRRIVKDAVHAEVQDGGRD